MSHYVGKRPRLRERLIWWLLGLVERHMFSVLPRGPFRRRMRDRIDSALARPSPTCGQDATRVPHQGCP
jgi:hypothetical protein